MVGGLFVKFEAPNRWEYTSYLHNIYIYIYTHDILIISFEALGFFGAQGTFLDDGPGHLCFDLYRPSRRLSTVSRESTAYLAVLARNR